MAPLSRYAVTWLTQEQPGGVAVTGPTRAYVRAYDAAGKPVTPPIFLTPTTPGPLLSPSTAGSTPKVAIRDSGEFVVVFDEIVYAPQSELAHHIYVQRFAANGTTLGGRSFVDIGENPDIALTTTGFLVSYVRYISGRAFVRVQRFDANGGTVGGPIAIDNYPSNNLAYIGSTHIRTRCTDEFIVLYHDTRSGFGTTSQPLTHIIRFSAAGTQMGSRITLNDEEPSGAFGDRAPGNARLVYLPTGAFNAITTTGGNHFLHRFDANGNPAATPEFLFGSIEPPSMAANSCGDVMLAWRPVGTDQVRVREYSYAGVPVAESSFNQTPLGAPASPRGVAVSVGSALFATAWTRDVVGGLQDTMHRRWILDSSLHSRSNVRVCRYGCGGADPCQPAAFIGPPSVPGYTYQWSPATYPSNPNVARPTVKHPGGNKSFEVTYTVTIDGQCCKRQQQVTVRFDVGCF